MAKKVAKKVKAKSKKTSVDDDLAEYQKMLDAKSDDDCVFC